MILYCDSLCCSGTTARQFINRLADINCFTYVVTVHKQFCHGRCFKVLKSCNDYQYWTVIKWWLWWYSHFSKMYNVPRVHMSLPTKLHFDMSSHFRTICRNCPKFSVSQIPLTVGDPHPRVIRSWGSHWVFTPKDKSIHAAKPCVLQVRKIFSLQNSTPWGYRYTHPILTLYCPHAGVFILNGKSIFLAVCTVHSCDQQSDSYTNKHIDQLRHV